MTAGDTIRPGDVLADRYRLEDLLTESGGGRFWRAHDTILERYVALHVVAEDDARAPHLLEAARVSAMVADVRLLRVLDAETRDGVCFVVNEWATGTSLDIVVAGDGPLIPRRAGWLVAEVADTIARAHDSGVAHGRLVPENILVDRNGNVRVIGFCVDAALHGITGSPAADRADLAGLLYCALTGRWSGPSTSVVASAPREHGKVLRPRQVRAGVPRTLDDLCLLDDPASARDLADQLSAFVGDAAGISEVMAARHPPTLRSQPIVLPPEPGPAPEPEPPAAAPPEPEDIELPTQAGLPIFNEEDDEVAWLTARSAPAPPPPPFEQHAERPLFAEEAERRTRPSPSQDQGGEYWPWDNEGGREGTGTGIAVRDRAESDETEETVPGRSWLHLAAAVAVAVLLLLAIVVAYNLGRGKTILGAEPDDAEPTASADGSVTESAPPATVPLTGLVATAFDPQGDPVNDENNDSTPLAVDGDPATSWSTVTYLDQLGPPPGLKTGVGLLVDLGGSQEVVSVELRLVGAPTTVQLYLSDTAPTGVRGLTVVAEAEVGERPGVLELEEPTSGQFLVVWLTVLPGSDDGFRGTVAEVEVLGAAP